MGLIIVFIFFLSCSNQNLIDTDKSYYDNNKIRYEVQKQNGKEHGIAKYWDINGNLIRLKDKQKVGNRQCYDCQAMIKN